MKNKIFSFLFFWLSLSLLLYPISSLCQQKYDSTAHYYKLILNPNSSDDLPNAINFYTEKKEKDNLRKDTLNLLHDLRMIALAEYSIGNLYDSEAAAVEALSLLDSYRENGTLKQERIGILNHLGIIYRSTKNYERAIAVYDNLLELHPSTKDSITIINNKGNIYKDQQKYSEAIYQYSRLPKGNKNIKDSLQLALVLDNLGFVQSKLGDPDALPNLKKAFSLRKAQNNLESIYSSYKNLALYYFDRNDKTQALNFANKAYEVANTLKSATYLQNALSLYAIMNDDPKIVQFKKITDSIAEEKQLAENKNAFIKYNVEKERKNTLAAKLLQEKEKGDKRLFMIIGISIFILAVLVILLLGARHKKEKILQVHKTEARISKKVHDEVANDVYQLMAKLQGKYRDDETIMDALETIYNKTRDISKENSAIEIEADFNEQLNDLLLSYQTDTTAISTRNLASLDWKIVPTIKKETVYRVLQELMTNMKKHSGATAVLLNFRQQGKNISIAYSDNGKGCALKNKNGMQNAENRIQAIKGTIIFESEPGNGFRSKISI
jgi:signal transduction histidine kinase